MKTTMKIIKYQLNDILRSRWTIVYTLFFLAITYSILSMSGNITKSIISLMNIFLFVVPLVSIIFGTVYLYNNREYIIFMIAQPINKDALYAGLYAGVSVSQIISLLVGAGIPLAFNYPTISGSVVDLLILFGSGIFGILIFTSIAFAITIINDNRLFGFGMSIFLWLVFTIIYDGLILLLLFFMRDYPTEKLALVLSFINPIDLGRMLIVLRMDISALMGYTGAVFNEFFGSNAGMVASFIALSIWAVVPYYLGLIKFRRKDF